MDRTGLAMFWHIIAVLLLASPLSGCQGDRTRCLEAPLLSGYQPGEIHLVAYHGSGEFAADPRLSASRAALASAEALDRQNLAQAVDQYYRAALLAGQLLQAWGPAPTAERQIVWETYHQALQGLIVSGQRHGRLDPRRSLVVQSAGGKVVPIAYHGFAWRPCDFNELVPAANHQSGEITQHHLAPGLGLPLVGVRAGAGHDEEFFRPRQPFAVTAVLRPVTASSPEFGACESVLELYNTYSISRACWAGRGVPLARDLTAPMSLIVEQAPRQYLRGFTAPTDTAVKPKLILTEPYQRGKIPVIFIHGLYSDPITWADTFNDLRAQGDLYAQYQFWVFRYPTGGAVLESAAELRANLVRVRQVYDPQQTDTALDAMVLVGHSMGGLLAKMQVTNSYDLLWNEAATQSLDHVRAPDQVRLQLARDFFFEPMPQVSRVIFVGTPHQGSTLARRAVGRISAKLVSYGSEADAQYRQLMEINRDVFKPTVARSRPTSLDFLDPDSPFLNALARMPIQPSTRLHSIIGTGGATSWIEPNDGVVDVASARHPGVCSERYVPAKHEKLHRDQESIAEIARILRIHAACASAPR